MVTGVSASLQERGMKISQSGQDATPKKQAGEQPTAGNGEYVSMHGCTNGPLGYGINYDDDYGDDYDDYDDDYDDELHSVPLLFIYLALRHWFEVKLSGILDASAAGKHLAGEAHSCVIALKGSVWRFLALPHSTLSFTPCTHVLMGR